MKVKLNEWWSKLPVKEKERIASKIASDAACQPVEVLYPNCTNVWFNLRPAEKKKIYEHVTNDHNVEVIEENEGYTMSY